MKELIDSLKALLSAVEDVTTSAENMDNFDTKSQVVINLDTVYNDLSYTLTLLP